MRVKIIYTLVQKICILFFKFRTKIHTKKNKKGFCCLSVTVACQPKDIKKLTPSKYSLDNKDKLPPLLIYKL